MSLPQPHHLAGVFVQQPADRLDVERNALAIFGLAPDDRGAATPALRAVRPQRLLFDSGIYLVDDPLNGLRDPSNGLRPGPVVAAVSITPQPHAQFFPVWLV